VFKVKLVHEDEFGLERTSSFSFDWLHKCGYLAVYNRVRRDGKSSYHPDLRFSTLWVRVRYNQRGFLVVVVQVGPKCYLHHFVWCAASASLARDAPYRLRRDRVDIQARFAAA
jgi:hypothetical protein